MLPAVLSIKTSLKAAVSADIADGRNLETLNTTSLCRAPILRIRPQGGIERKSCEKGCTKQERLQRCGRERDGYEGDVPAAKPRDPPCRGERRMEA
jgi:hypothetical protein